MAATEAQKQAAKIYRARHKEKARHSADGSAAKSYIKTATNAELDVLLTLIKRQKSKPRK